MEAMMERTRRGVKVVASLLALAGLLWAPAAGRAQEPVRIGFIYASTGPFAQTGLDMRDGFMLYLTEVGSKAGGRTIEVIQESIGSNKPDEALTKARKLVERDNVHILGGVNATPEAYALRAYVNEKRIPTVIMLAGADGLTQHQKSSYVFRSSFANSDSSHPLGEWAYKQGYRKTVIIAQDFGAGYEQIGGFARTFIEAGGQIIQEIYPPLGAPDFAPYFGRIRQDADVVTVFVAGADALRFVNQYAEFGLKGKLPLIGKGYLVDEPILPRQGDNALGIITSLHWSAALDTPVNRRFLAAYAAAFKRPAATYSEQGYVGAQMIVKSLEAVKGNTENQQAFLAALARVEVDAPRGKVRLDAYHNPIHPVYIRKVEKKDGVLQNTVIATYPNTSQFWKWSPEAYLAMPTYADMKGKWVK
jgi:branched-chain amino acid transport system substrate-binding protein